MLNETYRAMLGHKSVIRETFMYGKQRAAEIGYENVFDYSLGNPSVPCPDKFAKAMQTLLDQEEPVALHGYCPSQGDPGFRTAVAAHLAKTFGLPYEQKDIFPTTGAAGAIAHAIRAVTKPGDEVLTFAPCFPEYGPYVEGTGAVLKVVPPQAPAFQPNLDAFEEMLTENVTCVLINTPNNPTGLLPERGLLEAIAQRCRALNISLILDEAFLDFIPDQPGFIPLLAQHPHVWVLRSLTKFYAIPGLRLGYLLNADAQAVARLRARQMPWSINAYAALAGEIILQDRAYQRATWQWLQEEGARFYAQLQEMAGLTVWPGRANYLFLRCDRADFDLQYALLRQHVLIRSCANYPGLDSRYFRVAIRSAEENDQLLAALRRVLA